MCRGCPCPQSGRGWLEVMPFPRWLPRRRALPVAAAHGACGCSAVTSTGRAGRAAWASTSSCACRAPARCGRLHDVGVYATRSRPSTARSAHQHLSQQARSYCVHTERAADVEEACAPAARLFQVTSSSAPGNCSIERLGIDQLQHSVRWLLGVVAGGSSQGGPCCERRAANLIGALGHWSESTTEMASITRCFTAFYWSEISCFGNFLQLRADHAPAMDEESVPAPRARL